MALGDDEGLPSWMRMENTAKERTEVLLRQRVNEGSQGEWPASEGVRLVDSCGQGGPSRERTSSTGSKPEEEWYLPTARTPGEATGAVQGRELRWQQAPRATEALHSTECV